MKNVAAVGCALAMSVFPAMAADMPFKFLPPPAPVFAWTGCYLGGSLGGIWRVTDDVRVGVVDGGSGVGAAVTAGAIPTAFDVGGVNWIIGGQAGCNYQAGSWVLGVETDFSSDFNANKTVTTNVPPFLPLTSSVSQDMHWIGTTRGRLGWAWGNVLLYATGGIAYDNTSYTYAASNVAGPGTTAAALDSAKQLGWAAGGGLEWGFGAWSLKGEYLHYDLGIHTVTAACGTVIGGCTGAAPTLFSAHFGETGDIVRVGLNYRF
ncbi:MAG: porin family protein [Caulobacteraceae bacterium]|nr:porin family protein [Caulobacteraceae bacterium]